MMFLGFILQFVAGTILAFLLIYFRDRYKLPKLMMWLVYIVLLGSVFAAMGFVAFFSTSS